jgi:hypothetical protein
MSTKFMNFLAMSWFISILICLIMEGSTWGTTESDIINNLAVIKTYSLFGIFSIPVFNLGFLNALQAILLWNYSFYEGSYQFLRWFWLATLTPGAIWGLAQVFIYLYGTIISIFRPTVI